MTTIRFEQRITASLTYSLPSLPAGVAWISGAINLRRQSDETHAEKTFSGAISDGELAITVAAADTAALAADLYSYLTTATDDAASVHKIALGEAWVIDPLKGTSTDPRNNLAELQKIYAWKLRNRGDVIDYTIGDRSVGTMALQQIRNEMQYWETIIANQAHRTRWRKRGL